MFDLVFLLVTGLPLIGLVMMEGGAYGPDIYDYGHPNGASFAYALHLLAMYSTYIVALVVARIAFRLPRPAGARRVALPQLYTRSSLRTLLWAALVLNLVLLAFVLFVSGASQVVMGLMDRGQFRTQARYGYLAFLCRDFLSPMLAALSGFVYVRSERSARETGLLGANMLVTAASGAIWGYRAAIIMAVVPASLMLVRRMTIARATALVGGGFMLIVASSVFYEGYPFRVAVNAVVTRASTGTANATWRVWDVASTAPELIPPYAPTLTSAFGTRIRRLFGFDPSAPLDVSNPADYGTLATLLAKNFSQGVDPSSNVTTGVFAEGVIALGTQWFLLMSIAAGLVVAMVRAVFDVGQQRHRPLLAVMAAAYFMASVFSWLNSGGITVLFFVPLLLNYVITYWTARTLLRKAGIPLAVRRRPLEVQPATSGLFEPPAVPSPGASS